MTTDITVRPVEAEMTHDLRRRVLRDDDPDADVVWDGDELPTTVHLGAFDGRGRLIGVSSWLRQGPSTQLRGMAVEPDCAGSGVGAALVTAGVERCRRDGCVELWANARVTALGFYVRAGFTVVGDEFETPATGLPHRRIELRLD